MSAAALVFEIEELLFDTRLMRATALHGALVLEGIDCPLPVVVAAHAGVPAPIALHRLDAARTLDVIGTDLVLRRAADTVADALGRGTPSFDIGVRDDIERLAAEFPLAVVTRAAARDAQWLLEFVGLDACVRTIQSLDDVASDDHVAVWTSAHARTRASRAAAFAPGDMLGAATRAGLVAVQVGDGPDVAAHTRIASLATVNASFIATLF